MSNDIRIKYSFKDHRKRKKANLLLGLKRSATDYILDLWISCAENHPTGELIGMDETDIALEAGWQGEPKVFIEAMINARLIEYKDNTYKLHDWEEHQGWVFHSKERSEAARANVRKRWENRLNTNRIQTVYDLNTKGNTPSPSPPPLPPIKDNKKHCGNLKPDSRVKVFIDWWCTTYEKRHKGKKYAIPSGGKLGNQVKNLLNSRLSWHELQICACCFLDDEDPFIEGHDLGLLLSRINKYNYSNKQVEFKYLKLYTNEKGEPI